MFIYLASIIIVDGPAGGPHRDLIEFLLIIIIGRLCLNRLSWTSVNLEYSVPLHREAFLVCNAVVLWVFLSFSLIVLVVVTFCFVIPDQLQSPIINKFVCFGCYEAILVVFCLFTRNKLHPLLK
jgi:hypothetical protein